MFSIGDEVICTNFDVDFDEYSSWYQPEYLKQLEIGKVYTVHSVDKGAVNEPSNSDAIEISQTSYWHPMSFFEKYPNLEIALENIDKKIKELENEEDNKNS